MNIYDVSNKAGVSIATVSRVLNGNAKVSSATRNKVLDAMKELDYTPNVFARGLGLNTMKTIGIMCIDSSDIYLANAVYYLEQELRKHGYDSILCCTGKDYTNKKNTNIHNNDYIINAAKDIPIVLVNGYLDAPNIYSVMCNDEIAIYNATNLLINNGHRNIVYLYTSKSYSGMNKYAGYMKALKEADISLPEDYRHLCGKNISHAKEYLNYLYNKGIEFDAVVTSDDSLAAGAVKYAHSHSISVPDELEIIGFNNSVLSICTEPELTSIDSHVEQLSTKAVDVLMKVLCGESADKHSIITADIIKRNTTHF